MKKNKIHIDMFPTSLGSVNLDLLITSEADYVSISNSQYNKRIVTLSHAIEVICFDSVAEWKRDSDFPIESSKGWIVRITKTAATKELLAVSCVLTKLSDEVKGYSDSGEHLDAVWIEDQKHVVSIGTEDGEMLKYRAERSDWMPARFAAQLGCYHTREESFTKYLETGFQTQIPELLQGEKLYFHYLVATNPKNRSKGYPDEDDISTNFAVDFPKWTLLKKLSLEE
jgi:hypothetical protein